MNDSFSRMFSAVVLALGIAAAGAFINQGIHYFRNFERGVEVKGLAEQVVKSDLASWNIYFSASGANLQELYKKISQDQQQVNAFLRNSGFKSSEIQFGTVNVTDNYANGYSSNNKLAHYQLSGSILVSSSNIDLVASSSQNAGELINQGIIVTSNTLSYFYNGLQQIKGKMLDEATQNAAVAAATFAKNSQSQVGKIKTASQGVFTISSADGALLNDTQSLYKKVRVVTSVQFFLN